MEKARCTIFVSTRIMGPDQNVPQKDLRVINAELYRRQLRESVILENCLVRPFLLQPMLLMFRGSLCKLPH